MTALPFPRPVGISDTRISQQPRRGNISQDDGRAAQAFAWDDADAARGWVFVALLHALDTITVGSRQMVDLERPLWLLTHSVQVRLYLPQPAGHELSTPTS